MPNNSLIIFPMVNVLLWITGDGIHWVVMHWRFGGPCPKIDQQSVLQKQFVWQSIKRVWSYRTWTWITRTTCKWHLCECTRLRFVICRYWKREEGTWRDIVVSDTESASENYKNRGGCLTDGQTEDDAQTPSYGEPEGSNCEWTDPDTTTGGTSRWPRLFHWDAHP